MVGRPSVGGRWSAVQTLEVVGRRKAGKDADGDRHCHAGEKPAIRARRDDRRFLICVQHGGFLSAD
jgi:hypothetical protein